MKIKAKYMGFLFLSFFFVSCSYISEASKKKDDAFLARFPQCNMNSNLKFFVTQKTFKSNDEIWLDIQNQSQNLIPFPNDLNVEIFRFDATDTEQWIKIENNITHIGGDFQLEPTSSGLGSVTSLRINPVLTNKPPSTIRVSVASDRNGPSCIAAFVDIDITP